LVKTTATKGRFATAIVLLIALSFGCLTAVQFVRPLQGLTHSDSPGLATFHLKFTRHAIEEVSPGGPEPVLRLLATGLLTDLIAPLFESPGKFRLANIWPEFGQIRHRRVLPSSDDPDLP
jgi:hypothetical protein